VAASGAITRSAIRSALQKSRRISLFRSVDAVSSVVRARDLVQAYDVRRGLLRTSVKLQAVRGVSLEIAPGKTLAVVGESGSGKSTLGRMIGLIEKPLSGALELDGTDAINPTSGTAARLRRTVQFIFQNPYGSLNPRKKVGAILTEPLTINTGLPRKDRIAKAQDMMARVGLRPEHYFRYPHMFSGGQRQRIAIARALMLDPKLVVADEPVSALDVSIQAQVLNLLADLQRDTGVAYLFISHDLAVVGHIAHEVLVLYLGVAVEQGSKAVIFDRPLHPYTQALLASTPVTAGAKRPRIAVKGEPPSPIDPPPGCVFSTRCPYVTDQCRVERPATRAVAGRLVACHYAERFLQPVAS
jgi:dipeptide transport system ATP-binding protein